jgi:hypothetical protein
MIPRVDPRYVFEKDAEYADKIVVKTYVCLYF